MDFRDKKKRHKKSNFEEEEAKQRRIARRKSLESEKKAKKKVDSELTAGLLSSSDRAEPRSFFGKHKAQQDEVSSPLNYNDSASVASSSVQELVKDENGEPVAPEVPEDYTWDFVVVLPADLPEEVEGQPRELPELEPSEIVQLLHDGGLNTYVFKSVQEDELIVKVRASLERLKTHADMLGYRMRYDEEELRYLVEWGVRNNDDTDYIIKPVYISNKPDVTSLRPYEYIYGKFSYENMKMFSKADGYQHPFSGSHRMKLILSIMQEKKENGGCELNLKQLEADKSILAYYPLHSERIKKKLEAEWLPFSVHPWNLPIDEIREYFGEKIGVYFEFLGFYTTWLIPLTIAGLVCFAEIMIRLGIKNDYGEAIAVGYTVPMFALFTSIWAQLFLEYWKRTEITKAMEWGQTEFEEEESERPDFEGDYEISHIDGQKRRYFPEEERERRQQYSALVISAMILVVIGLVGIIFYVKFLMVVQSDDPVSNDTGSIVASVANAVQIQIMNVIYSDMAISLTERENHRTDTEFEDSLIAKLFAFQFVNSYASFFYVAYIKSLSGDPCEGTCMSELSTAIGVIFISRLVIGNAQEVLMPLVLGWWTRRQETAAKKDETYEEKVKRERAESMMSRAEYQFMMENYDASMGLLEDYAELAIQYGYVTLFVSAFPLAPFLSLLSNIVEIRTDGWKLLHAYRRAVPLGAEDIGTWFTIFQTITFASIVTNAGIICFTMDIFDDASDQTKVWIFVCYQYLNFGLTLLFAYLIEDTPLEVSVQLERQAFIIDKVEQIMNQVPDDEDRNAISLLEDMVVNAYDDEPPMNEKKHL